MSEDRIYSVSEVVGTSRQSPEEAVRNAVRRAAKTLRHLDWFEVVEIRGLIGDEDVEYFQVRVRIGFRLEE